MTPTSTQPSPDRSNSQLKGQEVSEVSDPEGKLKSSSHSNISSSRPPQSHGQSHVQSGAARAVASQSPREYQASVESHIRVTRLYCVTIQEALNDPLAGKQLPTDYEKVLKELIARVSACIAEVTAPETLASLIEVCDELHAVQKATQALQ